MPTQQRKEAATEKSSGSVTQVKYMGSSDIHTLPVGENFGNRLAEGLKKEVRFDWDNGHVADVSGMPEEAVELLLEDSDNFVDVTDLKVYPVGLADQLWRGLKPRTKLQPDDERLKEKPIVHPSGEGASLNAGTDTTTQPSGSAAD